MPIDLWLPPKPAIIIPRRPSATLAEQRPAWIFPAAGRYTAGAATRTFLQKETTQVANQTTYTFANCNIGAAASDRYIVAVVGGFGLPNNRVLSSVTIGGSAATIHANANLFVAASARYITGIAGRLVTTGTTATVTVVYATDVMAVCFCALYALHGLASTTPTATATETLGGAGGTVISDTINIPSNGILIVSALAATTTGIFSFAGADEDADENNSNIAFGCASDDGMSAETGRAYSATISANSPRFVLAGAAWN